MRVVLVLCLLAFMSCQKDIMDIAKCLYESPKVKEIIADVMVAIATKDFSKLWPKIKEALPELIPVVIKCITENEANLQAIRPIMNKWIDWNDDPQPQPTEPTNEPPQTYYECITQICLKRSGHQRSTCYDECFDMFFGKYIN